MQMQVLIHVCNCMDDPYTNLQIQVMAYGESYGYGILIWQKPVYLLHDTRVCPANVSANDGVNELSLPGNCLHILHVY